VFKKCDQLSLGTEFSISAKYTAAPYGIQYKWISPPQGQMFV